MQQYRKSDGYAMMEKSDTDLVRSALILSDSWDIINDQLTRQSLVIYACLHETDPLVRLTKISECLDALTQAVRESRTAKTNGQDLVDLLKIRFKLTDKIIR